MTIRVAAAENNYSSYFEGSTDYISIADGSQTGLDLAQDFTILGWVKVDVSVSGKRALCSKLSGGGQLAYFLWVDITNEQLVSQWSSNGSTMHNSEITLAGQIVHDVWMHIGVRRQVVGANSIMTLFFNGDPYIPDPGGDVISDVADLKNSTADFMIGGSSGWPTHNHWMKGWIDEVQVWSRALSDDEVALYAGSVLQGNEEGLEGYWRFENAPDDYDDYGPNGNDLVENLGGAVYASADAPGLFGVTYSDEEETAASRPNLEPKDLLLDSAGDITITDGDLVFVYEPVESGAQEAKLRLGLFQGEWFLDNAAGLPMWSEILGRKFNRAVLLRAYRRELLAVPEIDKLISIAAEWDGATRTAEIDWEAQIGEETISNTEAVEV